ncbi:hypothetical protein PHMEG_0004823 [Phytophthora megakarya]|uniref:Reverse transcriptase n=1 Tax=Phytophthora megakarya TaxID=4795 RepID=A0A225WUG8_9STRA|nr:hypothetical protein PHMEG_0004823 [Phytophthora megakarya]
MFHDGEKQRGTTSSIQYTIFGCPYETTDIEEPVQQLVNGPEADMFRTNLADEATLIPVLDRRSVVDDICFGGEIFDKCLSTVDRLLTHFEECRISISFTKIDFGAALYQLKNDDFGEGADLSTARRSFDALNVEAAEARFFVTSIELKMLISCCSRMNEP